MAISFNKLTNMIVLTIIIVILTVIFVSAQKPEKASVKQILFPELAEQIDHIDHIYIKAYNDDLNFSLRDGIWVLDEFDGYPVFPEKIKSTLLGVANLKINSPKTALPRLYRRLGVEGPEIKDTSSLLLTLKNGSNKKEFSIIVGKSRLSSYAKGSPGLYVRKPSDSQSYLVDGTLDISADKPSWVDRSLFDIAPEKIKSISISHADGDYYRLFKEEKGQGQFEYENLPEDKKIGSKIILNRFGTILQDVQITSSYSVDNFNIPRDVVKVNVRTFDGVLVDILVFAIDDIAYAKFGFDYSDSGKIEKATSSDINELKEFVRKLQTKTTGWVFEISSFKYDIIKNKSNYVLKDKDNFTPTANSKP